jgi:hypothetical protein
MSQTVFLRRVLILDAVASGATGLLMLLGAELLEQWLNLPAALLRYAGISLLPFAAIVAWLGLRASLSRAGVWAVIALNVLWVVDSAALLVSGWVDPALLGYAFVIFQAAVVAVLAELEFIGLRQLGLRL